MRSRPRPAARLRIILMLSLSLGLAFVDVEDARQTSESFGWTPLSTGVGARLRGVSAISDRVAWASGAPRGIRPPTIEHR